jgi:UDP-N-acetylmuramoylalanine--D-glutamate ligase
MFKVEDFKGKKAGILGFGRSGRECAELLKRNGFQVFISEEKTLPVSSKIKGVPMESGGHTDRVLECDFIIKSPGISAYNPIIKKIKKRGIKIFSELEVAAAFLPKDRKIFAITGTNGKTTSTEMLGQILKMHCKDEKKKRKVFVVGNIGAPLSAVADKVPSGSLIVLEVSSYQLEDSGYFKPDYAAILNITPDHLVHHGGFDRYLSAKRRIFKDQAPKDYLVINGGDSNCVKFAKNAKSVLLAFSSAPDHKIKVDVFYDGDEMVFATGEHIKPPKAAMGTHNVENAMAAALMAFAAGVNVKNVQKAFNSFAAIEHRIELFAQRGGIKYFNDSKATNVDSTLVALKAMPENAKRIWLILGGRDKGAPYSPLEPYLKLRAKTVLIGEAAPIIYKQLAGKVFCVNKGDIPTAVSYISAKAKRGDIVLLSPACASFDQFKDYEERGRFFKKTVLNALSSK